MNQYKHLFLAMFFIFGLAGCTKELSEDIEIQVAPGQPRVFAIDTSIDAFGKAKDIKAPWFAARITVTNNNASESGNAKTAVITGITYYVTKPDGTAGTDGGFVAKDITGA
ncbi:MAG: hypothetical protein KDD50_07690, partial [Bdellovibrionales bacterium]|nr:hypothetical protein [Bdellovibrionales bacterium]